MSASSYRPFPSPLPLVVAFLVLSPGSSAAAEAAAGGAILDAPSVWRDGAWTAVAPAGADLALAAGALRTAAGASGGSDLRELWPQHAADGEPELALFGAEVGGERCLWRTDGTVAGTFRVAPDGECVPLRPDFAFVGGAPGVSYFVAGGSAYRFWRTDGTAAGTWPLMGFADEGLWNRRFQFVAAPSLGLVLFYADDGSGGSLWVGDGSPESARRLDVPGIRDRIPFRFQVLGSAVLFFVWRDGHQYEMWKTDGTAAGTALVEAVGSEDFYTGPGLLYRLGERVVFFLGGIFPCWVELWTSDGSAAGTEPLRAYTGATCPGSGLFRATSVDGFPGSVFFATGDAADGVELWRTDGTAAGSFAITDLAPEQPFPPHFPLLSPPVGLGGEIFFAADGGDGHGREPWKSAGTPGSVGVRVADVCPGSCSSHPGPMSAVGGHVVFAAEEPTAGREPWTSDGTAEGTRLAGDLCPGGCSTEIQREVVFGGSLLFIADDGAGGQEWWTFTPTAGPARLTDLAPARPFDPLLLFQPLGDRAVFAADDGEHGREPWVTDGTAAGTHLLVDLQGASVPPDLPAAPSDLAVEDLGGGLVRLTWQDNSSDEDGFLVEFERLPAPPQTLIAAADATSYTFQVAPGRYRFRVRSYKAFVGPSAPSNEVEAVLGPSGTCEPRDQELCLGGNRFRVSVHWQNQHAAEGDPASGWGHAVPAGPNLDDSGYFWFFTPENLELVVKVLDGTPVNGHYWVFWGALSDVGYTIQIEDTTTGEIAEYRNPPGRICGGSDTTAFPRDADEGGFASAAAATAPAAPFAVASGPATRFLAVDAAPPRAGGAAHPFIPCVADDETLCLLDGKLAVTVEWSDQHNGGSGVGQARPYSDLTGFFWFFHPENVELVVKALDGRTVNGKIWLFYGALSDVGYTIRVENREDGHAVRTYENPPGLICGRGDTAAF